MGTRSITLVKETYKIKGKRKTDTLLAMYRQFDSYVSGHGQELVDYLKNVKVVNGLSSGTTGKVIANGAGCLAGLLVSHFKGKKAGGFYIMPSNTKALEEYHYEIIVDFATHKVILKIYDVVYTRIADESKETLHLLAEGEPSDELIKTAKKVQAEYYKRLEEAEKATV